MSELKPCPFCGGEARREDDLDEGGSCISCKKCMACSAVHFDRRENLVSDWNRRTPLPPDLLNSVREELALQAEHDRGKTHWEGCEESHPWCRVNRLLRDILEECEKEEKA